MHSIFQNYTLTLRFVLLCCVMVPINLTISFWIPSLALRKCIYTVAPVPVQQPWRIWVNNIYRSEGKYDITTTKQCTTNYYTLDISLSKVHESRYKASPTETCTVKFQIPNVTDSLLLMWINFNPAWINNYITPKCGMKLFINSHTSTVAAIEVWEWRKIFSSHIFWVCDYLSMLGL